MKVAFEVYVQKKTIEHPSFLRDYQKAWREKDGNGRRKNLKDRYGITVEQYEEMLAAQGGKCALCGGMMDEGRRLAVDHDHETGEVRGILHVRCNTAIALFKDSPEICRKAAEYLEKFVRAEV